MKPRNRTTMKSIPRIIIPGRSVESGVASAKDRWIRKYATRILDMWLQREAPLGVASTYAVQVSEDLVKLYEDPLKRVFIEATY